MPRKTKKQSDEFKSAPAFTPEGQEQYMISLAYKECERRIKNHEASSQEIVHFLKLGSNKEYLEQQLAKEQLNLVKAKTEALQSAKKIEELYNSAIVAMRSYSGKSGNDDEDV